MSSVPMSSACASTAGFVGKYFLTGDTVEMDAGGNIAFVGRGDDIITSSGYRIGPFDVESCLIEHPVVSGAAVIGKPDPERTEIELETYVRASPAVRWCYGAGCDGSL